MANEAVPVEGPYTTHDWTVGSTSGIEQYSVCTGGTPRLAQASTATDNGKPFAGIAMTEKEAGSNETNLGLTRTGIFDMTSAAGQKAMTVGDKVSISGLNTIKEATAGELLTGAVVGECWEDFADAGATGEIKLVDTP